MSVLDRIFSESSATNDAALAELSAQLTQAQQLIATQQEQIDAFSAANDLQQTAIDANTALNTAQEAARAATELLDSLQTTSISDLFAQVTAAQAASNERGVRVARFVPVGEVSLTQDNFDAAFRAAYAWCWAQVGPFAKYVWSVVLPAGEWPVSAASLDMAGTYLIEGSPGTPGITGPGSASCALIVSDHLPEGRGLLEIGNTTYAMGMRLQGFRIESPGTIGIGIRVRTSYQLHIEDVRVEGFSANQHYDSGWGIAFEYPPDAENQHQHVTLRHVRVSRCQSGIKLWCIAQLDCSDVWVNQCWWLSHSYEQLLGAVFSGGNLQGANSLSDAAAGSRWYSRTLTPECSTGWSYTTGMPSGTAASLSTTTLAVDADTGIANVGKCTLTGLTGMTANMVGNWISLIAASGTAFVDDDNVAGLYQISDYISATSVKILKGTNHTAKTGVIWQVRGHKGGNRMQLMGYPYHEGARRCVMFLGPDLQSDSQYAFSALMSFNTMPLIAQGRIADVSLMGGGPITLKAARLRRVQKFTTDHLIDQIATDSYSRQGIVARRLGTNAAPAGLWQGAYSHTKRLNSFVSERGGWSFDPARLDKHTLSGTDITQARSVQDDSITLGPQYAAQYASYVASDSVFGGPCWNLAGGAAGASKNLVGLIPGAKLPTERYLPTLLVVARLPNTTVDAGAARRMLISSSYGSGNVQVAFHDGAFYAAGNYAVVQSAVYGGSSISRIRATVDTDPHAYAVRWDERGNALSGAALFSDELSGFTEYILPNFPPDSSTWDPGADLELSWNRDYGGGNAGLLVRYVAVMPYGMSPFEIDQFFDLAANECRVVR